MTTKTLKSIRLEDSTIAVIKSLLGTPENLRLKGNFNKILEHLIETHPDFI